MYWRDNVGTRVNGRRVESKQSYSGADKQVLFVVRWQVRGNDGDLDFIHEVLAAMMIDAHHRLPPVVTQNQPRFAQKSTCMINMYATCSQALQIVDLMMWWEARMGWAARSSLSPAD